MSDRNIRLAYAESGGHAATKLASSMSAVFDSLRPGQTVYAAFSSVMGMGGTTDGQVNEWIAGKKSISKVHGVETIPLNQVGGVKSSPHNQVALRKRGDKVSASKGDMGIQILSLQTEPSGF